MFRRFGLVIGSAVLVACQGSGTPTVAPTTPAGTSAAAATVAATPTLIPATAKPKPIVLPRAVDVPLDGSCEEGPGCLGLLEAGKVYTTTTFKPIVSFSVPTAEWDNPNEAGGEMPLFSTRPEQRGDVIFFFSHAQASDPAVGGTYDDIVAWLKVYDQIAVSNVQPAKLGGLEGVTMDVRVAPTAVNAFADCPVQVCVDMLRGNDTSKNNPYPWHWEWGPSGTEVMRLYLLDAKGNTVVVLADSVDGLTFDKITASFDAIAPTIKFKL